MTERQITSPYSHQANQAVVRRLIAPPPRRSCSLEPSVTTSLYSTAVSQALRQPLRSRAVSELPGTPASPKSYRVSRRSKRSSRVPSPSTAWNRSSGSSVERDQHPIAVPPLPITPHTHLPPLRVLVGVARSRRSEGHISTCEAVPVHSLAYRLPRTHLLGTWVNKGK
jgi:hypothetical protein